MPTLRPAVLLALLLAAGQAAAQNAVAEDGLFVTVPNPLTSDHVTRIKNRVEAARNSPTRPVKVVVFDFTPGAKDAATADFGTCYSLASYLRQLHELKTVAFVTAGASGHTVLPVLACKELAIGKRGSLGEVSPGGETLTEAAKAGYGEVLGDSRDGVKAVARKMFDRGVSLGKGQKGGAAYYLDLREKAEVEKRGVTVADPTPLPSYGQGTPGVFPADVLLKLGVAAVKADDRTDLADLYHLSANSLKDDPLGGRPPVAFVYNLPKQVDGGVREASRRVIADVVRQKGNVLIVVIDVAEGDIGAARDIAEELRKAQTGDDPLLVVGFIPDVATAPGALIALGCTELVMSTRKGQDREAVFGEFDAVIARPQGAENLQTNLRELAAQAGYPPILFDAMLDREMELVRAHAAAERGRTRLMTGKELETEKPNWVADLTVKPRGQFLTLPATRAAELGLARFTVPGTEVSDVFALYGLEAGKVKQATPGWLDRFATYLRIPAVTLILVVIGFAGLILELKVPGTTIPGITAALCFILVFWAHTGVNGNAAILGGLIFALGLVLILLELFVFPGFGAPGILGVLFLLAGIGLATVDRIPQSTGEWMDVGAKMATYMLALIAAGVLAFFLARFLPHVPYANRMMLESPADVPPGGDPELPGVGEAAALLGAVGTAATTLRPAGMAQFGDRYVDVVTDGGYISAGTRIQVVEVEAARIVVKEV